MQNTTPTEQEEKLRLLKIKVSTFFNGNIAVHCNMPNHFINGHITEISSDFFMVNDFVEGLLPVFFLELKDISPYKSREEMQ